MTVCSFAELSASIPLDAQDRQGLDHGTDAGWPHGVCQKPLANGLGSETEQGKAGRLCCSAKESAVAPLYRHERGWLEDETAPFPGTTTVTAPPGNLLQTINNQQPMPELTFPRTSRSDYKTIF
ncbi:hypothetical protein B0O80DRAFT_431882 [Mortierella sp. GBAus27b]|nr:hypothetical protein B0O80DRAFT_431882 [Mortierella sp. GBAus27b]